MEQFNKLVNKFYKKLILESFINSSFYGVTIAGAISAISALIFYCVGFDAIWLSIVLFFVAYIITTLIVYFIKYKPTKKDVARRIDMEGLEERMITMYEQKDSDSFMAKMQRKDALAQFDKVKNTKLKLNISKTMSWVSLPILAVTIIMNSLVGFSFYNGTGLPPLSEIVTDDDKTISVSYIAEEGGIIEGEEFQIITQGEDASQIVAVPEDGYVFCCWSDGTETPNRRDISVDCNSEYFATFIKIETDLDPN